MKKLTLVVAALVMGFMMTSCGDSKKDTVIAMFNNFFDAEEAILNEVEDDADAMLEYLDASDQRFGDFYAQLDEKFPINQDDELIGFSKADSDAAMQVYDDRLEHYSLLKTNKGEALFEPYLAEAEDAFYALLTLYMGDEGEPSEEDAIQAAQVFDEKFDIAERYYMMGSEEQLNRFSELWEFVYGDEEEE